VALVDVDVVAARLFDLLARVGVLAVDAGAVVAVVVDGLDVVAGVVVIVVGVVVVVVAIDVVVVADVVVDVTLTVAVGAATVVVSLGVVGDPSASATATPHANSSAAAIAAIMRRSAISIRC
jgi:hypothetical protein